MGRNRPCRGHQHWRYPCFGQRSLAFLHRQYVHVLHPAITEVRLDNEKHVVMAR